MISFDVKIENADKIRELLKSYPITMGKETDMAVRKSILMIEREAKINAPVDTGLLRTNIHKNQISKATGEVSVGVRYAIAVHEGTRPHWPNWKDAGFQNWAHRKGMNPYLVARAISRRGTKANPFLRKAVESSKSAIKGFFKDAVANTLKSISGK